MSDLNKINFNKFADFLKNIPVPEEDPKIPKAILEALNDKISNISNLIKNIELSWLSPQDNRLGVTTFSDNHHELFRKKRLNLPLGEIKISLHPILFDDKKLYNHTLVHEILHASGMIEHSEKHDKLTNEIAPAPTFSESIVLKYLQAGMISSTNILSWECKSCKFIWTRNTIHQPLKCPKCSFPYN